MDCQMNALVDGLETTKILKKMIVMDKIKSGPIVVLTASQDKKTLQKGNESRLVGHLNKTLVKEETQGVLVKFEGKTEDSKVFCRKRFFFNSILLNILFYIVLWPSIFSF